MTIRHWVAIATTAAVTLLLAACSNPEADWQTAETENTEAAYQVFLEKHPEGEWAEKAQAEIDRLKDTADWENAQTADAIDGYNNYLLAHPTGLHMGEARQRISELEIETAWSAAQTAGTRDAYEDFLIRYATAPQAEDARSALAALTPPAPPAAEPPPAQAKATKKPAVKTAAAASGKSTARPSGKYQVQLGAFSALSKAQSEKARMEKRYHDVVGSLSVQNPSGSNKLWRVRSSGMPEANARSACQKLKNAGQDCTVVSR